MEIVEAVEAFAALLRGDATKEEQKNAAQYICWLQQRIEQLEGT